MVRQHFRHVLNHSNLSALGGPPLSFSFPTHPDHVLHAILGGAHSPQQTRRSVRNRMARSSHAYWCIYPRLTVSLFQYYPRNTVWGLGSSAKLFGRPRRPYSILVYTGLPREHARLNHYLPSDTPARLLQCLCLRLWTSTESLRIHACLEISAAPPQRVVSSHLNLCTLAYCLSSLGLVHPMHVTCPPHTLFGASHPQISRMQSCTNRPALHHWPAVPRAPRSSSLNLTSTSPSGFARSRCPWAYASVHGFIAPTPVCSCPSASPFLCPRAHPTPGT